MKRNANPKYLPRLAAVLGIAAAVLRLGLYLFGRDNRNLLSAAHPLNLLVWTVTAAAVVLILASVRKLEGPSQYRDNFPPSVPAALGAFALAGGIAATVFSSLSAFTLLERLRNLAGILAVAGMVAAGLCRGLGKRPFFGCHGVLCLYLTLFAVSHYQTWCSRPQLQDYFFAVLGCLLLALFAYYQTAFDADLGQRRMQLGTGLLAGFTCLAALGHTENAVLYLTGSIWALTNLCSLSPAANGEPEENDNAPS